MSQFSQTYGSFTRTGDYPLEANYIFPTEEALINFYTGTNEEVLLHLGLLKVVGEGDVLSLYWVVKEGEELVFKKLLENVDRDNLYNEIINLQNKLLEEITNRENAISEIWGDDKGNILTGLNSIKKISDALNILIRNYNKLHDEFNALVGVSDRDIIEYLKTLPYLSLTEVIQVLDNFLNGVEENNGSIDTLPELKDFLDGYTEDDTLSAILENLYLKILGTPIPTDAFKTLRGIEDLIITLNTVFDSKVNNLLEELNTTLSGVGLNLDGSYSPDTNSNYLLNSTSITNALHILDNLIYTAILEYTLDTDNSGNIILETEKTLNGYKLKGNIKLNPDIKNLLNADNNGIYYNVDLTYTNGTFLLLVNDTVVRSFNIGVLNIILDAFYDSSTEELVVRFKLIDESILTIRIPVSNLIREWDVDNTHPSKVVELTKEEVFGDGADKLSADVRISTLSDNILTKDGNTLYVSKNLVLPEITNAIDNLKAELTTTINNLVETEKNRAQAEESKLLELILGEVTRATGEEASIRASILEILGLFPEMLAKINDLTARVVALEVKTSW